MSGEKIQASYLKNLRAAGSAGSLKGHLTNSHVVLERPVWARPYRPKGEPAASASPNL